MKNFIQAKTTYTDKMCTFQTQFLTEERNSPEVTQNVKTGRFALNFL
jgi:hypothetical protein